MTAKSQAGVGRVRIWGLQRVELMHTHDDMYHVVHVHVHVTCLCTCWQHVGMCMCAACTACACTTCTTCTCTTTCTHRMHMHDMHMHSMHMHSMHVHVLYMHMSCMLLLSSLPDRAGQPPEHAPVAPNSSHPHRLPRPQRPTPAPLCPPRSPSLAQPLLRGIVDGWRRRGRLAGGRSR